MNISEISLAILKELERVLGSADPAQLETLADEILAAKRLFIAGTGRSLLMMRGLAMRLMQFGLEAYVVGETVTPAILPGELFVIGSGSGETGTMVVMANKAKAAGANIALLTIYPDSTIGKLADYIVHIAAATSKGRADSGVHPPYSPGQICLSKACCSCATPW